MLDPTDQQLVLEVVREVAGDAGLKALRAARGGTEVWIVRDPSPDHWMSQVFGYDVAQEIARRLTVTDADGRRSCGIRCYVGYGMTRFQEFKAQLTREVVDEILSGKMTRQIAIEMRVPEREVYRQRQALIADGRLKRLPPAAKVRSLPAPPASARLDSRSDDARALWEVKAAIVDDGLLRGHSNRRIAGAAQVGRTYIRMRRKLLFASGRLKPGRMLAEVA